MQTKQLLCWNGMTDTEHTASGSYEDLSENLLFLSNSKNEKFFFAKFSQISKFTLQLKTQAL